MKTDPAGNRKNPGKEKHSKVSCIGMDMKIHTCYPDEIQAVCGELIQSKKVSTMDILTHFSCGECTY